MNKQSISLSILIGIVAFIDFRLTFLRECTSWTCSSRYSFGEVIDKPYEEGLHIPVNPLYNFTLYDIRKGT